VGLFLTLLHDILAKLSIMKRFFPDFVLFSVNIFVNGLKHIPMPAQANEPKGQHPLSGNIRGRGCSLMSLGLI